MRGKSFWWCLSGILFAAMAGGMGWGIRGQYGHQTGAMIAGVLVGFVLTLLYLPRASSLSAARVVAFCALGVSVGGSMTYGQTVGLTHDQELVGNWDALRWGLIGLFIKGGIWIGFCGLMFGIAASTVRYRPIELALVLMAAMFVYFAGIELLNEPFRPADRQLPEIYFSDHWDWEPDKELKPRRERWGGLLFALITVAAYVRIGRGDRLALRLACWGAIGGGIGFATGQSLQAWHAWSPETFRQGWFAEYDGYMNWWNMMETTFGAIFGGILAVGVFLNRRLLATDPEWESDAIRTSSEVALALVHCAAITAWSFRDSPLFDHFADNAIPMILIPVVAVSTGRLWPYLMTIPVIALPIAGKTVRQLSYNTDYFPVASGWLLLFVLPMVITVAAAIYFWRRSEGGSALKFCRPALLLLTWLYFCLNYVFFEFPWPWAEWTGRTPNGLIFSVCVIGLTLLALLRPTPTAPDA